MSTTFAARTPTAADQGSSEQHAVVAAQLRRLRSWEDPSNTSPTAVVYRELLAAVERHGPAQVHGWGDYNTGGDRAKHRPNPRRVGADGLTRAEREAAIDRGELRLTRDRP